MPDFSYESAHGGRVGGIDEVGRGPLAGPVVAAVVVFTQGVPDTLAPLLNDSKKLSARARDNAYAVLKETSGAEISIGAASVPEIEQINILQASFLAMRRAVARLQHPLELALIDGKQAPQLGCPVKTIVKGDSLSYSIAAASIVAKVVRDRAMDRLGQRWPTYGWERNSGYGTAQHMRALTSLGPTPHHRAGFAPVKNLIASGAKQATPTRNGALFMQAAS